MIVILMGVTGAGKTTVGSLLAAKLEWDFADGDDFHSAANVAKMKAGVPLGDADRVPWLSALHEAVMKWTAEGRNVVLACSALKRSYRDQLRTAETRFVYLHGSCELIAQRVRQRHGHFATESILKGQFADLEEPHSAISVDVEKTAEAIVAEIIAQLAV